jgi:hypothetical protein
VAFFVTRRHGKYLYRYEVESYWDRVKRQPRQRTLRFLGRVDKHNNVIVPPAVRVDSVSESFPVGSLALFYAVARELDLVSHIKQVLEVDHDTAAHILCLALNQIGAKRPLTEVPAWVARSPLPRWEGLKKDRLNRESFDVALSALCRLMPDGRMEDRGLVLQEEMTRVWRNGSREPAQFYYDVTRQIYYGSNCPYAEPGYYPGGTSKNVLGFGLVTSRNRQHPVLCRAIRGSRHDTLTVQDMVNHLKGWGYKHLTLIMDRGMISEANVEHVAQSGFDLVGIVPQTNQEVWDYITHWSAEELERPEHVTVRGSGKTVYVRSWQAALMGRKRMRVVLVLDPGRAAQERAERNRMLHLVTETADPKTLRALREELGSLAIPAPGRRGFEIDAAAAAKDREVDGRFLMFSTDLSLSGEEIFQIYFQRDEIEKAFLTFKGELSLGRIRYRRRDRIDAYTTVVYLAYLLWSRLRERLRQKYPSLTVTQALGLVEDLHLVRFQSGKQNLEWLTRRTPAQERLLKSVGARRFLHSG